MINQDMQNKSIDNDSKNARQESMSARGTLVAGLLAGFSASACCAGPLILLMLGISGSWIGNLSALESVRPFLILAAVIFLVLAYQKIYRKPKVCTTTAVCSTPQGQRTQKLMFWITTSIIVLSIAFPWYGPLLFD